jgi:ribosomal protein L30/L7E
LDTKSAELLLGLKDLQTAVIRGEKTEVMDMINEMLPTSTFIEF